MKALVEWLRGMEQMAGAVYRETARLFSQDLELARFLNHLKEDESWHMLVIESAAQFFREEMPSSPLALDAATKSALEAPFREVREKIEAGNLTKGSLIDCVVQTEYSEWNDYFVYVVNELLKDSRSEFIFITSKIEQHKQFIERYIQTLPNSEKYLARMRSLPKVWNTRMLIVEDYKPLREILPSVLSADGEVETAENGKEALEKVKSRYYDFILSDVDMPVMSGIEFYEQACLHDPHIAERFLFLADFADVRGSGKIDFLVKNGLSYLRKPVFVSELKKVMQDILSKTPQKIPLIKMT